jgi:hypothetical protein
MQTDKQKARQIHIIKLLQRALYNGSSVSFIQSTDRINLKDLSSIKQESIRRLNLSPEFFKGKTFLQCFNDLEELKEDFGAKTYVIN